MKQWLGIFSGWWRSTVRHKRTVDKPSGSMATSAKLQWLLALVLGFGLGLVGPYGTYFVFGLPFRLLYWIALVLIGFAVWAIAEKCLAHFVSFDNPLAQRFLVILPFAIGNATIIVGVHQVMLWTHGINLPVQWFDLVLSHIVMSSLVITPMILIVEKMRLGVQIAAGSEAISFLTDKLPSHLKGHIPVALSAEGHYVSVHTASEKALITMKFEDALRAVVGIDGLQTHRSWWVALDKVATIRTAGSAYEAVLESGLVVPVSRRRGAGLRKTIKQRRQPAPT